MKLTARVVMFIALRFGKGMTLKEVGKVFGMTRETARMFEAKILRTVRANGGLPKEWVREALTSREGYKSEAEMMKG